MEVNYDKGKFIGMLNAAEDNNVIKSHESAMNLIYNTLESSITVTPTLLEELDMNALDDAIDVLNDYLRYGTAPENPLHEMQSVVTAKMLISSYRIKNNEVEDIDFF